MNERSRQRNAKLLLGLTTIVAGFLTWRAGQIGSDAAYADRTSIGQTMTQEQRNIEVGLAGIADALAYVRYVADYAEANGLDWQAAQLEVGDDPTLADAASRQAEQLRLAASARANSTGLFGRQQLYRQLGSDATTPLPFDLTQQLETLEAEANSGIATPALDPDKWAKEADDIRARIRALRIATLVLLVAVASFTVVQVTDRAALQYAGFGIGAMILVTTTAIAVATVW